MAYHYENLKLEKGMYGRSSRSFSQALEELDPSEHYRGTPLEGLDAFQRQLKRFDIHVKGAGSDMVEKFSTPPTPPCCSRSSSPEWCGRGWRKRASCRPSPLR